MRATNPSASRLLKLGQGHRPWNSLLEGLERRRAGHPCRRFAELSRGNAARALRNTLKVRGSLNHMETG